MCEKTWCNSSELSIRSLCQGNEKSNSSAGKISALSWCCSPSLFLIQRAPLRPQVSLAIWPFSSTRSGVSYYRKNPMVAPAMPQYAEILNYRYRAHREQVPDRTQAPVLFPPTTRKMNANQIAEIQITD